MKKAARDTVYLYVRKKGIGRMNYYVIRGVRGCKRRKERNWSCTWNKRKATRNRTVVTAHWHFEGLWRCRHRSSGRCKKKRNLKDMGKWHEDVVGSHYCASSTLVTLDNCEILEKEKIYRQSFILVNKPNNPSW